MPETQLEQEVLTLVEAAEFLRVTEDALSTMADNDAIPAQKINGEWRFLKRALADWLRYGRHHYHEFRRFSWFPEPLLEELIMVLQKRFGLLEMSLKKQVEDVEEKKPKPGSKEAVRKHFGIWRDDPTAEAMLEEIDKRRGEE